MRRCPCLRNDSPARSARRGLRPERRGEAVQPRFLLAVPRCRAVPRVPSGVCVCVCIVCEKRLGFILPALDDRPVPPEVLSSGEQWPQPVSRAPCSVGGGLSVRPQPRDPEPARVSISTEVAPAAASLCRDPLRPASRHRTPFLGCKTFVSLPAGFSWPPCWGVGPQDSWPQGGEQWAAGRTEQYPVGLRLGERAPHAEGGEGVASGPRPPRRSREHRTQGRPSRRPRRVTVTRTGDS